MTGMTDALLLTFGGVVILLIAATAVGSILTHRSEAGEPRIEAFVSHIRALWFMTICLALALGTGQGGVVIVAALASFMALREFVTLTRARRADHWVLIALFYLALPIQYWAVWTEWYGFASIFIPVYVFLLLPVLAALRGRREAFLVRVAEVQWAAMIAIYCLSHVPLMLTLDLDGFAGRNRDLIAFLVVVVYVADAAQFLTGRWLGRRQIAPELSRFKTVEGLFGGAIGAALAAAALAWLTPFAPWQAALLGVVVALMGFFGSLALVAVRRDRGVRDWGQTETGRGGVIDRLDGLIFAAPIFFHLTRYFFSA